jgi:hypothetical protein
MTLRRHRRSQSEGRAHDPHHPDRDETADECERLDRQHAEREIDADDCAEGRARAHAEDVR